MKRSKRQKTQAKAMSGELTAGQLIDELSKYPKGALIVFLGPTPDSLHHTVSSVFPNFDISHLFDPELEQSPVEIVYLKTNIFRFIT